MLPMCVAIRTARPDDAEQLVELMALLDHSVSVEGTRDRLAWLAREGIPQLVAITGDEVVGLCGLERMVAIHREQPVGRITILVVKESARGCGIGTALVEQAVAHFQDTGCRMVEVTSNLRLAEAHRFYEQRGFVWTSKRLAHSLS